MSVGMPPDTLSGDLGEGLPAQFRVRPDRVVIVPPGGAANPVLHRLAGRDVVPLDPPLL